MYKSKVLMAVLVLVALAVMFPTITSQSVSSQQVVAKTNRILARNADILTGRVKARPKEMMVSGGVMTAYMERLAAARPAAGGRRTAAVVVPGVVRNTMGCSNEFRNATQVNVRVNQDCSFRRQAEESLAINPLDSNHLIAGQNDSRVGFNACGIDFSFNRGKRWGDMVPPFYQFIMLDGQTADACSDPTSAFDSQGNAYFGGILFKVTAAASAVVVAKSNAAFGGTFYHSPDSTLTFQEYRDVPLGVVANADSPDIFHDKELMAADSNPASPKKDNVYMTWTRFANTGVGVGANSPINFSQSTNGGATWSAEIEISGANKAICNAFSGSASAAACDQDQGSHPFVGPDGAVYVVFGNGNTPLLGINQVLFVKCPAALDCSLVGSWSAPAKVADLIGTHPFGPDPATGCAAGRQCLPPNGYRVPEFTSITGSIHPTNGRLFVTWADSRNLAANCNPLGAAATAVPPCDNDAFVAYSDTGGATWSGAINVSDAAGDDNNSAQWQPWSATGPNGTLYFAYYDRKYNTCETTGCNDITLAVSTNAGTAAVPTFTYHRITTSSMPNLIPANNPIQAGFLGDYMWVAADSQGVGIVWADTRPRPPYTTPEEDIYFARFTGGGK